MPGAMNAMSSLPAGAGPIGVGMGAQNNVVMGQPSMMQQPGGMIQQPGSMIHQSSGMMHQSSGMMHQPAGMMHQPAGMMHQQAGMMQPPSGMMQPSGGMVHPQPGGLMQTPGGMMQPPGGMMQQPSMAQPPMMTHHGAMPMNGVGVSMGGSFDGGVASFEGSERPRMSEAEAAKMQAEGQLLVGLLCAALYPQVIAVEREESKKKKGMNAPVKLRIRDRNEDGTGASDPVEVALHPSSVNANVEKQIASSYLIYHEKVRTTRVYVRDCSPVSAYALILFGGVLSSQPGTPLPPPPPPKSKKKRRSWVPPPPVVRDGILVIDGWIRFSVSVQEQRLLLGVREKLDSILASKIESPELEVAEAGEELLAAVSKVLACN